MMEMYLPKMNGVDVIQKLQDEEAKIPIIVVSSSLKEDADTTVVALEYGAVEFVVRPFRLFSDGKDSFERDVIKAMRTVMRLGKSRVPTERMVSETSASVKRPETRRNSMERVSKMAFDVKKTTPTATTVQQTTTTAASAPTIPPEVRKTRNTETFRGKKRLVAIASSTGGPQALHTMIPMLPKLNVPVVIVQHMPKGFTQSLAERLDQKSAMRIKEAEDGDILQPNVIYLAPGGRHLEIKEKTAGQYCCRVFDDPPVNNLRPCADVMYKSLETCSFDEIVCVVLTGMGQDGSDGIASLGQKKKIYTITQSADTCVVYGMPKAADQRGLSDESASITNIANAIAKKLGV